LGNRGGGKGNFTSQLFYGYQINNIGSKYRQKVTRNSPRNRQTQHTTIQPIQLSVLRPPCYILEPLVEKSLMPSYSPNT